MGRALFPVTMTGGDDTFGNASRRDGTGDVVLKSFGMGWKAILSCPDKYAARSPLVKKPWT